MHKFLSVSGKGWQNIPSRVIKVEAEQLTPPPGILTIQREMRELKTKLLDLERAGNGRQELSHNQSPLEDLVSVLMVKNWSLEEQVHDLCEDKQLTLLRSEKEELQKAMDQKRAELVALDGLKQAAEERASALEADLVKARPELEAAAAARAELAMKVLALQSKNVELTKALKCAESKSVDVVLRKKVANGAGGSPERNEVLGVRLSSLQQENETLRKAVEEKHWVVEQGMRELHRVRSERDKLKRVLLANDAEYTDLEKGVRSLTRGLREEGVARETKGLRKGATKDTVHKSGQQGGLLEELTEAVTQLKGALAAAEARAIESEGRAEELLGAVLPRLAAVEACSEKQVEETKEVVAGPSESKGECEQACEQLRSELQKARAEVALVKRVSKAMGSALIATRAEAQERALALARLGEQCFRFLPLVQTCVEFVFKPQGSDLGGGARDGYVAGVKQRLWQQLRQLVGGVPYGGFQGREASQVVASESGAARKRKADEGALPVAVPSGLGYPRQPGCQSGHGRTAEQGDRAIGGSARQQVQKKRRRLATTEERLKVPGPGASDI